MNVKYCTMKESSQLITGIFALYSFVQLQQILIFECRGNAVGMPLKCRQNAAGMPTSAGTQMPGMPRECLHSPGNAGNAGTASGMPGMPSGMPRECRGIPGNAAGMPLVKCRECRWSNAGNAAGMPRVGIPAAFPGMPRHS